MSTRFNQMSDQFNNRQMNNRLINGYQQYSNQNTPFINNPMLMNNPLYYGSIRDSSFYDRLNMAKLDQLKKIKDISDLNLSQDQLVNYVICPIKVEKMDKKEQDNKYHDRSSQYTIDKKNPKNAPKILQEWWSERKNTPYKNILKDQNYKREFKDQSDLIVHKVTQLDKDKIRFENELLSLLLDTEVHDGELKIIFSKSEEGKHLEKFTYVNSYKNRIKYDPKNYDELKQFYKKAQRQIKRDNRRIEEMLEYYIASDELTKDDIKEIEESVKAFDNSDVSIDMKQVFKIGEEQLQKQLEQQLMKELKKELGKEAYSELMKEIDCDEDVAPKKTKIKTTEIPEVKHSIEIAKKPKNVDEEPKQQRKVKVKVTQIEPNTSSKKIGHVDDDELEKYNNRE